MARSLADLRHGTHLFAPHHAEELWAEMGEEYSVHEQAWRDMRRPDPSPGDNARSPGQRQAARPYRCPGRYLGRGGQRAGTVERQSPTSPGRQRAPQEHLRTWQAREPRCRIAAICCPTRNRRRKSIQGKGRKFQQLGSQDNAKEVPANGDRRCRLGRARRHPGLRTGPTRPGEGRITGGAGMELPLASGSPPAGH